MDQLTTDRAGFPLSDLQQAYLIGELGDFPLGGPALFYEEYRCDPFDTDAFLAAVDELVRRHPMLRCAFDEAGLVLIRDDLPSPVRVRSLRDLPEPRCAQLMAASRQAMWTNGPPLSGPAAFSMVIWERETEYHVQMCGRLMVFDGQSGEVFAQELRTLLAGGDLTPIEFTYRDYRRELDERRDSPEYDRARRYWMDRLDDLPGAPELPMRRNGTHDGPLSRRTFALTSEQTAAFSAALRRRRLTPTMAVAAAFAEVLRHWSRHERFTINVMYGERVNLHPDVSRLIGSFSSTLLLECSPGPARDTFAGRAGTLRGRMLRDFPNGAFGGVQVIRELNRRTGNVSSAQMPVVFTSMLGIGAESDQVFLELLGWQRREALMRTPQVIFDHQVYMRVNEMVFVWDTADGLFPLGLIDEMFAAYQRLLTGLATADAAWDGTDPPGLTPAGQLAVRAEVNDTAVAVTPHTLHGMFLSRAAGQPDATALVTAAGATTYRQLRARAGAVAAALREAGCGPGDLVAVVADRGVAQVAALLGVLMTGAAYVPVSPAWPVRRRAQIMTSARVRAVLCDRPASSAGAPPAATVLDLATVPAGELPDAEVADDAEALAYVIFTSGTTGTPKGVMIRHQSAANTIADLNERFGVTADDRVLAVSDFTFDLSVYDVFGLLAAGGAVVVPDADQSREVVHLHELTLRAGVTLWNSVPAYLAMFVEFVRTAGREHPRRLRLAMVSGDWVPLSLSRELAEIAPNVRCVALGGATEASIWSNWFDVPAQVPAEWTSVPYGRPLGNQQFHVLDGKLADRPDWVPGELFIAGRGLADGYLGAPELTAAAFIIHPRTGQRLYRTGDRGRYWPDGVLEFLGREDPQVKINGFRVELGEIETALLDHPAVNDTVVVARKGERGASLVAFVAADLAGRDLTGRDLADQLRQSLAGTLPSYMVPSVIEVRTELPLTANGKVDRTALTTAAAGLAPIAGPTRAPRRPTERRLVDLWTGLLDQDTVGIDDGFFALGGSSLQAAQLMNRIEREFGTRLPLAALYRHSTVAALADLLDAAELNADRRRPAVGGSHELASGDGPAVVLVHPVGGDLLCYRALVDRLAARWMVLGIAAPALDGTTAVPSELAELAGDYLTELAPRLAHDAPVRLVGWSLGAVLAYEMGRQLTNDGRSVEVVLLDPWVGPADAVEPAEEELLHAFLTDVTRGDATDPVWLAGGESAQGALRRAWPAVVAGRPDLAELELTAVLRLFGVFVAHTRALVRYPVSATPDVVAHLVEAETALGGAAGGYLVPLRTRLPDGPWASVHRWVGDHFAVVDPLGAKAVADTVAALLEG